MASIRIDLRQPELTDLVDANDWGIFETILLLEAMKTFNEVRAPRAGKVVRLLVADGTPVEYGEPLVILE